MGSHSTKCRDLEIALEKSKCRASNVQIKKKKWKSATLAFGISQWDTAKLSESLMGSHMQLCSNIFELKYILTKDVGFSNNNYLPVFQGKRCSQQLLPWPNPLSCTGRETGFSRHVRGWGLPWTLLPCPGLRHGVGQRPLITGEPCHQGEKHILCTKLLLSNCSPFYPHECKLYCSMRTESIMFFNQQHKIWIMWLK